MVKNEKLARIAGLSKGVAHKLRTKRSLKKLYKQASSWYGHVTGPDDGAIWLSIIVPVYNSKIRHLNELLNSFNQQDIQGVELIFSDDASSSQDTTEWLRVATTRSNVTVIFNSANRGISAASNEAILRSNGQWIAFLDHDDLLAPYALKAIYETIQSDDKIAFIYTDELIVDDNLKWTSSFLKPAFDPILLSGVNYINHLSIYRKDRLNNVGLLDSQFDGSQDYDFLLRYTLGLDDRQIRHLPYPAYWWRVTGQTYSHTHLHKALTNARSTLHRHFDRNGYNLQVEPSINRELHKLEYTPEEDSWPKIGVILPSKNAPELIAQIVPDLFERTDYSNFEVLIVDNGSDNPETLALYEEFCSRWKNLRISTRNEKFNFSRSVNRGFREMEVDHYLLLNNDVKVIDNGWLKEMVSCLAYKDVGIVGAKLLFGDDSLQHAGVIVGQSGLAGHWYYKQSRNIAGSMGRLHVRNGMACVTGAVMLISKDCAEKISAFDEHNFAIAYNDVDYCMRAHNAGFRIVWTPHACLYHLESVSRGSDKSKAQKERFAREKSNLARLHQTRTFQDPANHPLVSKRRSIPSLDSHFEKPKPRRWFDFDHLGLVHGE